MKYLLFNTKQEAQDRSEQEAQARHCSGTTKYWWTVKQTKAAKWALCIDNPYPRVTEQTIEFNGEEMTVPINSLAGLTPTEISNLKNSVVWPNYPTF